MTTTNDQYAAIEIRKVVLPPRQYGGEHFIPQGALILTLLDADLRAKVEAALDEYDEAWDACVENLAPMTDPKVREKAYGRLQVAQDASLALTAEVDAWLDENIDRLRVEARAANLDEAARALAKVEEAGALMLGIETRKRALSFMGMSGKRWSATRVSRPDADVDVLTAKLEHMAGLGPKLEHVDQATYTQRQRAGEDMTLVRVRHNRPQYAGTPS